MFKKTILATCLALAATAAIAQSSSVTVYGLMDLGLVRESGRPDGQSINKVSSGVFNGSRLGFRGREDLGDGLAAIFVLEMGLQADTGTLGQGGLGFGRQSYVGLSSPLGQITLGRQYTAFDDVVGTVDPFGSGGAGRDASLVGARFVNGVKGYYNNRINNDVMYKSPVISGFSGDVAYGFGEVEGSSKANRFLGISGGYAKGPLYARIAAQDIRDATGAGFVRNEIAGLTYDFGAAKGYVSYALGKVMSGGVRLVADNDILLGVSVPVGVGYVLASYVRKDDRLAANNDANLAALGYWHYLSKRTLLYVSAGRIQNRNAAAYTVNTAIDVGSGSRSYDLGIRHTF